MTYEPGELTAVGYHDGAETGRYILKTAGEEVILNACADRTEIAACASRQLLVRDGRITRDEGKGVVMDVV